MTFAGLTWEECNGIEKFFYVFFFLLKIAFCVLSPL